MTKLEQAIQDFTHRDQFHNQGLLDAIIQAARDEEKAKFTELTALAKKIAGVSLKERQHCKTRVCSDSAGCICGCAGCCPI